MNFSKEFDEVRRLIQQKRRILLATHERPDGDALGSMIAMFSVLRRLEGKETVMFSKDPIPPHLSFLPYCEEIVGDLSSVSLARGWRSSFTPDLFLGFDYGDFSRLGIEASTLRQAVIVTFDHHPFFKQKGDVIIIDSSASSTCELVYHFLCKAGYRISSRTATALLTGIFTDTGGFAHVNTTFQTLRVAGDLLRYGISLPKIQKRTFSSKSPSSLRVWGHALRRIVRDPALGMAYVTISFEDFGKLGALVDDFEGIVNIINTPSDVRFSLLLIEHKPGFVKGSLRGEPFKRVDVSHIARALGGGGHKYAAGFELEGETLKNALERVKIVASRLA